MRAVLALAMAFSLAACTFVQTNRIRRKVAVTTSPAHATVWVERDGKRVPAGDAPVQVTLEGEEKVHKSATFLGWIGLGTAGAMAIGGLAVLLSARGSRSEDAGLAAIPGVLMLIAAVPLAIAGLVGLTPSAKNGEPAGPTPRGIIGASLPGYHDASESLNLLNPLESLDLKLMRKMAPRPARVRPPRFLPRGQPRHFLLRSQPRRRPPRCRPSSWQPRCGALAAGELEVLTGGYGSAHLRRGPGSDGSRCACCPCRRWAHG